jgi:putative hemolysin
LKIQEEEGMGGMEMGANAVRPVGKPVGKPVSQLDQFEKQIVVLTEAAKLAELCQVKSGELVGVREGETSEAKVCLTPAGRLGDNIHSLIAIARRLTTALEATRDNLALIG